MIARTRPRQAGKSAELAAAEGRGSEPREPRPRRLEARVDPEQLTHAGVVATYKALLADARAGRPHAPRS